MKNKIHMEGYHDGQLDDWDIFCGYHGGGMGEGNCAPNGGHLCGFSSEGLGATIVDKWEHCGMKGQCDAAGQGFG